MAVTSFIDELRSKLSTKTKKKHQPTTTGQHYSFETEVFNRMFCYFDENGDGKISPAEFCECLKTAGEEVAVEDVAALVRSIDSDGDDLLGFEDFVALVDAKEEEERGRSLREAFRVYEVKGEGCITSKSLRKALRRLGMSRTVVECEAMIREFDLNGDGVISFEEFENMML